jgi:molybdopterin-binding protein
MHIMQLRARDQRKLTAGETAAAKFNASSVMVSVD